MLALSSVIVLAGLLVRGSVHVKVGLSVGGWASVSAQAKAAAALHEQEGEPREGLPLNFADHALYLGTRLGLDPLGLG